MRADQDNALLAAALTGHRMPPKLARPMAPMRHSRSAPILPAPPPQRVQHRSAPVLLHDPSMPSQHAKSAATVHDSRQPRVLPTGASSKLVTPHLCRRVLEAASTRSEELVVVVEMNPIKSRCLHQSHNEYVRHLELISDAISACGNRVSSTRFPGVGGVGFDVAGCVELPKPLQAARSAWGNRGPPAFDDYRRVGGELTSNVSWTHSSAHRYGAFEVYLVVQGVAEPGLANEAQNLQPQLTSP